MVLERFGFPGGAPFFQAAFAGCGCLDRAGIQINADPLFHFRWELRHRSCQLLAVHVEHDLFEHRKRNPAAGFFWSEGTVVVKADADGDGDSFGAVGGAHEQRIPEVVRGSCLAHDRVSGTPANPAHAPCRSACVRPRAALPG